MAKFNLVVEYDFYDEYNAETFEDLVAEKVAEQIAKDISFGSAGAYRLHIEKVSSEIKNEVVKRMLSLASEETLKKFESKIEAKLNRDLDKEYEKKMYDRMSNKIKKDVLAEVKGIVKNEVKNTFRSL